jgi:hypothetical protein
MTTETTAPAAFLDVAPEQTQPAAVQTAQPSEQALQLGPTERAVLRALQQRITQRKAMLSELVLEYEAKKSAVMNEIVAAQKAMNTQVMEMWALRGLPVDDTWTLDVALGVFRKAQ